MEIYNPLICVEQRLGNIETWPSSIISYLFLVIPTRKIIKHLTAFFTETESLLLWVLNYMIIAMVITLLMLLAS